MDTDRFDRLTRRLTLPKASRRLALAAPLVALGADLAGTRGASARTRCKKNKRCGKDCCGQGSCLVKEIDPNSGKITIGCCPKSNLCHAPEGDPDGNQCCYSDEKCNPTGESNGENNGNGLCCRTCNGLCCAPQDHCVNGECVPIGTARLPRRRPA